MELKMLQQILIVAYIAFVWYLTCVFGVIDDKENFLCTIAGERGDSHFHRATAFTGLLGPSAGVFSSWLSLYVLCAERQNIPLRPVFPFNTPLSDIVDGPCSGRQ